MNTDFNNTITSYPSNKTLVDLFLEQVAKTPENIAIRFGLETMTYSKLNEESNKLANYILEHLKIQKHGNIGILVSRSPNVMIGMLAILKSGYAYVPIDPEYPIDRQEYIINNSEISLVLHDLTDTLKLLMENVVFIDINKIDLNTYIQNNVQIQIDSTQLAYTIYTSGSTGRPKGVMIMHHSVVNLIQWVNTTFEVGEQDSLLFITSICFDLSVYDIFGILSCGGSIAIAKHDDIYNIKDLSNLLKVYQISFWDSVPTTLDYLVKYLESNEPEYKQNNLRLVFLSGDWIPLNLSDRITKFFPNAKVISLGGATEGTIWSNYFPIQKIDPSWKSIPYGKPISNNFFYILDENLNKVPNGTQGELFIGGVGVAVGYANDLEKTNYSFLNDPFDNTLGGKMYRTGDLGRMLDDGNMEFLGRKDQQVKIRGFRVELGEIESIIRQCEDVDNVIVIANDVDGLKRLNAYVVPKNSTYKREDILNYLKSKVPDYMIPGLWMELETLPITSNGKIDRKNLPTIENINPKLNIQEPRNDSEAQMVRIWESVLKVKNIGVEDSFFDLGGDSLRIIHLLVEIEKEFKKKIKINTIIENPTVAKLVNQLNLGTTEHNYQSLIAIKESGSKKPLYILPGDGLNIKNFQNLARFLDNEQPLYTFNPESIKSDSKILDSVEQIALHYMADILKHNPNGPYLISGYSFGGIVALELKLQLEKIGKRVQMFIIFDTDVDSVFYLKNIKSTFPKKIIRQIPKLKFNIYSLLKKPGATLNYQRILFTKRINATMGKLGMRKENVTEGLLTELSKIDQKNIASLRNYNLKQFNGSLFLFKSKEKLYFIDDFKYMGWRKIAIDDIKLFEIPGDHKTIFYTPNVQYLAAELQKVIDSTE